MVKSPHHFPKKDCLDSLLAHEDDIICGYEAGNDSSFDTASLSLTQEGSLLSSFSDDTQEDVVYVMSPSVRPYWHDEPLRQRRSVAATLEYDDYHDMIEEGNELWSISDASDDEDLYHSKEHDRPVLWKKWTRRRTLRVLATMAICATLILVKAIAVAASKHPRWKLPASSKTSRILTHIRQQPVGKGLTLRIRGSHVDLLTRSLEQHVGCPLVKNVQIDWLSPNFHIPESLLNHPSNSVQDLLSRPKVETEAIMLLDEGVLLSCDDLERAWNEWQLDPSKLVGFLPFQHSSDTSYSLVSDEAALFHRFYLHTVQHAALSPECQKLALSAWVTAISHTAPIAMQSDPIFLRARVETPEKCSLEALQATGLSALPTSPASYIGTIHN